MTQPLHIERFLLVAGAQDTGKSTQLRAMFCDPRFGSGRRIPTAPKPKETYELSPGRRLYLRLSSPHENNETLERFLEKTARKTRAGRWCVASAVQIEPARQMPSLPCIVSAITERFSPERIRIAILSPDRRGVPLRGAAGHIQELREVVDVAEVMCIDARTRVGNGLLLADTFDFT
jgi:hypothetical protein